MAIALLTFGLSSDGSLLVTGGLSSGLQQQLTALIKVVRLSIQATDVQAQLTPDSSLALAVETSRAIATLTPEAMLSIVISTCQVNTVLMPANALALVIEVSRVIGQIVEGAITLEIQQAEVSGRITADTIGVTIDAPTVKL